MGVMGTIWSKVRSTGVAVVLIAGLGAGGCAARSAGNVAADGSASQGNASLSPASPVALATGRGNPGPLVVDDTNVYWVDETVLAGDASSGEQILSCAKRGCDDAPTVLARGDWGFVAKLVLYDGVLTWAAQSLIYECKAAGCGGRATVRSTGQTVVDDFAVDPTGNVYVVQTAAGSTTISECTDGGCAAGDGGVWSPVAALLTDVGFYLPNLESTAQSLTPTAIAIDATGLYVVAFASVSGSSIVSDNGTAVVSCTLGSCAATSRLLTAVSRVTNNRLALDDAAAYFSTGTVTSGGTLERVPKDGSSASSTLVAEVSFVSAIDSDGKDVYFAELGDVASSATAPTGRISRCAVSGCGGVPQVVRGYIADPRALAVDDANVYWTDTDPAADGSTHVGRVMVQRK